METIEKSIYDALLEQFKKQAETIAALESALREITHWDYQSTKDLEGAIKKAKKLMADEKTFNKI